MPGADSRPELPEGRKPSQESRHGDQGRRETSEPKSRRSETRSQKLEGSPFKQGFKLQFEVASSLADQIVPIQAEESPEILPDPATVKTWRQSLIDAGMDRSRVSRMSTPELIVWGQRLIHVSDIEMPDGESPDLKLKRLSIKKAGDLETEERLTVGKVKKYVKFSERSAKSSSAEVDQQTQPAAITRSTISSEKPLPELPREEVVKKFKEAGIGAQVPDDWDELKQGPREDFLSVARVVNEVEPIINEREITDRNYLISEVGKGKYLIYGFGEDFSREETQAVLDKLKINAKIPRDWEKHKSGDRQDWLADRGIDAIVQTRTHGKGEPRTIDGRVLNLTAGQIKRILDVEVPEEWVMMSWAKRSQVLLSKGFIPSISGGGIDKPDWSDRADPTQPIGPANPAIDNLEANSRQDLVTVIDRRLRLVNEGFAIAGPGHDWTELGDRMNAEVARMTDPAYNNYVEIRLQYESLRDLQEVVVARGDPVLIASFETIFPIALRDQIKAKINDMNANFDGLEAGMTPEARMKFFRDVQERSSDLLHTMKVGLMTEGQYRQELVRTAVENPVNRLPGHQGILLWYALEQEIPNVSGIMTEVRELQDVTNPDDLEKVVRRGLLKADSTSLYGQDLESYYQKVIGVLQTTERFKSPEFNTAVTRLYGEINSSLLEARLFAASQSEEGGPDAEFNIHKQIQDDLAENGINSKQLYLERFGMKYSNGEGIEGDDRLPIINPATGQPYEFNLGNDAINLHFHQVQEERLMLNEIEDAQREHRPINPAIFTDRGYKPYDFPARPAGMSDEEYDEFVYKDINKWFQRNTLIGASNEVVRSRSGNLSPRGTTYFEMQQILMRSRIKKFLKDVRGLTPEQIKRMEMLIRAVSLNAYRWVRTNGGSEFDGIDFYAGEDKPKYDIFSSRTPFFMRYIDNPFKHFRNEFRGRPTETNRILEESVPMGHMLPTVRKLVRYTDIMYLNPANSPEVYDVAALNARYGLTLAPHTTVAEAVKVFKKKIAKDFQTTEVHAEGVAIAEMINRGHIRFGRKVDNPADVGQLVDWEEEVRDAIRFNFTDITTDRQSALKMYERGAMQELLRHPTWANLMRVYGEVFYSGRNVRLFPNIKFAITALSKMRQHTKEWFHHEEKGSAVETHTDIKTAVESGRMDTKDEEETMRELLGIWIVPGKIQIPGIGPVRGIRMWADFSYYFAKKIINPANAAGSLMQAVMQMIVEIFKQSAQQMGATR